MFWGVTSVLFALATFSDLPPPSNPPESVLPKAASSCFSPVLPRAVCAQGFRAPSPCRNSLVHMPCPFLSTIWMPQQHHRLTKIGSNSPSSPPSSQMGGSYLPSPRPETQTSPSLLLCPPFPIQFQFFADSSSNISLESSPLFLPILMANMVALATAMLSLLSRLLSAGERARFPLTWREALHLALSHSCPLSPSICRSLGFSRAAPSSSGPAMMLGKSPYRLPVRQINSLYPIVKRKSICPMERSLWMSPPLCQQGCNGLFPFPFQTHLSRIRHHILFDEAPDSLSPNIPLYPHHIPGTSRHALVWVPFCPPD